LTRSPPPLVDDDSDEESDEFVSVFDEVADESSVASDFPPTDLDADPDFDVDLQDHPNDSASSPPPADSDLSFELRPLPDIVSTPEQANSRSFFISTSSTIQNVTIICCRVMIPCCYFGCV
jgi:hypothetical protein